MTFDDDTKLFGLLRRYSDPEEAEELKNQVVNYVRTQIHDVNTEIQQFQAEATNPTQDGSDGDGNQMFDVSSYYCVKQLISIDGFTWGSNARNAQEAEDGPPSAEYTARSTSIIDIGSCTRPAASQLRQSQHLWLGCQSQPAAKGDETIPHKSPTDGQRQRTS